MKQKLRLVHTSKFTNSMLYICITFVGKMYIRTYRDIIYRVSMYIRKLDITLSLLKIRTFQKKDYMYRMYGTAQFKLDIHTCVLVQSLKKFVTELASA